MKNEAFESRSSSAISSANCTQTKLLESRSSSVIKNIVMGWRAKLSVERLRRWKLAKQKMSTTNLVSKIGGKRSGRTEELRYLPHTSSCCPVVFLVPLGSTRTTSMRCTESKDSSDLHLDNLCQQQPVLISSLCFFFSLCSMYCTLSSTVCLCKLCQQSKPHQHEHSFSRGHDPFAHACHACKARPLSIVGWTALSVSLSLSLSWNAIHFILIDLIACSCFLSTYLIHLWFKMCFLDESLPTATHQTKEINEVVLLAVAEEGRRTDQWNL